MLRFLLALALPVSTWACSCMGTAPPCQAVWKATAVFRGTVAELTRESSEPDSRGAAQINGFLGTHAVFEVSEPFLGMDGRGKRVEIRTGMGGGDCGYPFALGQSYVVYAFANTDGQLLASICSRTLPVERAQEDLTYLRSLKNGAPAAFVFGVVGDGGSPSRYNEKLQTYAPPGVAGATVTLTGPGKTAGLVTGEDGSFRFDHLAPGKYKVAVSKDGYSLQGAAPELELHAGGCAYAWESLVVDRRITGRVTGADGLPAAGIQIELVPARPTQENQLPFAVNQAESASDGTYELRNIRPGEYYLGVNLAHTATKEIPYARYFYPGTEDPSHAGIVIVKEAAGSSTYHFPIPAAQQQRTVEGSVYWPDGRPAEKVGILLEDLRWPWQTSTISAFTDAKGHFAISAFDGTAYRIHAVSMGRFTNQSVSAEPLPLTPKTDLSKPLQLILTRKGHSAAELTGKGLERWRAGLGF